MTNDLSYSLPLPPRRVKLRRWGGILVRCGASALLLPHLAIGLASITTAACLSTLQLAGTERPGKVLERSTEEGRATVVYAFQVGSQEVTRSVALSAESPALSALEAGSTIQVRTMALAPRGCSMPSAVLRTSSMLWAWAGALFWNAVVSVFAFAIWRGVYCEWKLARYGQAMPERVVDKRVRYGSGMSRGTRYEVYFPSPAGIAFMGVSKALFDRLPLRAEVTVLYDRRKPSRAMIYELSRFEAVGDA